MGRHFSSGLRSEAMPMLSALDRLEARGLPRWISLLGVKAESRNCLEQNGTCSENLSLISALDSRLEEASVVDRQVSLLSQRIAVSWSRRSADVHSHSWCSSKIKHKARGLPTDQPTDPSEGWPNTIYTNSFATPRHSQTIPSNEPAQRSQSI